jgi:hypothetical protein
MLIGARLNWLLAQGKGPRWSTTTLFVQVDISPTEIDSNRAIAAPVVADIGSAMSAFLAVLKPGQIQPKAAWLDAIAERKQHNIERMGARLSANPNPMDFYSSLRAIRDVLANKSDVYVVNEGANTLDFGRDIIDMHQPRKRLDCGTWGETVVVTSNLLHFADVLVGRFLSAPACAEGQVTHSRPTVTEVAIPGCAWASYSIGACAGALAIVTVRAPLLFPILVVILLVADMLLNAESKPVVRMAGASPVAGRSGGQ